VSLGNIISLLLIRKLKVGNYEVCISYL